MALTNIAARTAKGKAKPYKLFDGKGLYLEVMPTTARYWRLKYRFGGKEKRLALGVYPEVSLAKARERCDEARKLLAEGFDPRVFKRAEMENTFEPVAREWHEKQLATHGESHRTRVLARLKNHVFPVIGGRPIAKIEAPEILLALQRIEKRGTIETAHRVLQICSQVFRYAIVTGRAKRDPARDLRGALTPLRQRHYPTITDPKAVGGLLRALAVYDGTLVARCALRLAPLVFVRPGELRKAQWPEFDLDAAEWRIPAARMKMREQHLVPLSTQAVAILREIHEITGRGNYVFPGARSSDRPMSENTVNAALRRLGYGKDDMTGHGFRSMASTLLNEQGWNRDAIERQLAHAERDNVRAAYNFAEHLPERRKMMQAWADYLDRLVAGAEVVALKAA